MNPLSVLLGPIADIAGDILKRVLPAEKMSEAERAKVETEFKVALLTAEDKVLQTRMSAIVEEAKSSDPWTSRARPSFLYVMYVMILISIPMGITSAISPSTAADIAEGMKSWLQAIPDALWAMFGTGYLGYVVTREYGKKQLLNAKKW